MKLKKVLCSTLAAVMALSVTACSGSGEAGGEQTTAANAQTSAKETQQQSEAVPAEDVKELTLMIQTADYSDGVQALVDYVNANSKELGASLVLEKVPDGDQGEQVIQVRYAGGEDVPDILYFQPVSYANTRMDVAANFVDLTDNDYSDIYSDSYLRTPGYLLDGKLYNVPIATGGGTFMFYNKTVLAEAGITEIPDTWEKFLTACETIKSKGIDPVFYSGVDTWTLQMFALMGWYTDYAPEDAQSFAQEMETNKKHWSDMAGFIDSIAKIKELVDKGYVQETYLSDTYQQAQQALLDGTCAFYPIGDYVLGEMEKIDAQKTADEIGAFLIPLADTLYSGVGVNKGFYVSKNGQDAELAEKVMNFMVASEGQQVYFDAKPGIPMAKGVQAELKGANADIKNILDTAPLSPQWTDFCKYQKGPLETYISEVLVGTKTPEDVAAALDEDFAKAAKNAGDANWN